MCKWSDANLKRYMQHAAAAYFAWEREREQERQNAMPCKALADQFTTFSLPFYKRCRGRITGAP